MFARFPALGTRYVVTPQRFSARIGDHRWLDLYDGHLVARLGPVHGRVFVGLGLVEVELLVKDVSCLVAVLGFIRSAGEVKPSVSWTLDSICSTTQETWSSVQRIAQSSRPELTCLPQK